MKKIVLGCTLLLASMNAMAFGEVGQWSSGWGQGVSEYTAVSAEGNSIYIACDPDDGKTVDLPSKGSSKVLPAIGSDGFSCFVSPDLSDTA